MLEAGKAYRCFCSPQVLQTKRRQAEKQKKAFLYDQKCRHLSETEINRLVKLKMPFAIRLKLNPGETTFDDIIRGEIIVNHRELDDFVILRSNGSPVYHLAVVVDDYDMNITDVIRGDDHLSNTPKQILIYQAIGWQIPNFGHVPLIHGFDGSRLSKRHGSTSVGDYRQTGILSAALFNYLCLLGWSPGDDRELMPRHDIIKSFTPQRISKKNAIFDEKKLRWINHKYLSQLPLDQLLQHLMQYMSESEKAIYHANPDNYAALVQLLIPRSQTIKEIYHSGLFFFNDPVEYEEKGITKYFMTEKSLQYLQTLHGLLSDSDLFQEDNVEDLIRHQASATGIKAGDLIHPLRLALTGVTASPGIFEILVILGKQASIRRLESAIQYVKKLNV